MSFFKNIQEKLGRFKLNKEQKRLHRKVKAFSLGKASTIGILYNATDPKDAALIKSFIQFLKEERKEVLSLGFIDVKERIEQINPVINYTFFDQNDLSKTLVPQGNDVHSFMNKSFSILIDLNTSENCFPLEYISSLSVAKFKVGAKGDYRDGICDLVIDVAENDKLEFLMKQINHYLNMIKN